MKGRRTRRLLLAAATVLGVLVVAIGPWPTYGPVDLEVSAEMHRTLDALNQSAARSDRTLEPGRLLAGWASSPLTLPPGIPLAGYGDRQGKPSTGFRDPLAARALILSDGKDTVVLLSSDLLIVPPNVAQAVRAAVRRHLPLRDEELFLSATHTHSGPGAFAPGWAGRQFAGDDDPAVVEALTKAFSDSIFRAHAALRPARLGSTRLQVGKHVVNRARPEAPVDPDLQVLVVEDDAGRRALAVAYAAHATLIDADNMELSADYPGYLVRALERGSADFALFLAGAVGSMGPVATHGTRGFAAAKEVGESLAGHVAASIHNLPMEEHLDLASAATSFHMPPFQLRIHRHLRLSPLLVGRLGIDRETWISAVRLGDTILVGTPGDFSGELSGPLKNWATERGVDLWVLSFNGDYIGYISPDAYYNTTAEGPARYETYTMSWHGPQQGELFGRLIRHVVELLGPPDARQ